MVSGDQQQCSVERRVTYQDRRRDNRPAILVEQRALRAEDLDRLLGDGMSPCRLVLAATEGLLFFAANLRVDDGLLGLDVPEVSHDGVEDVEAELVGQPDGAILVDLRDGHERSPDELREELVSGSPDAHEVPSLQASQDG